MASDTTAPVHPVDQVRPLRRTVLFGVQHMLVMVATPISSVFLISAVLGLDGQLTLKLLSTALVLSGVGTIVQSWGLGPFGSRLPFVMLPGGAPVILFLSIAEAHGTGTAVGAVLLTGAFMFLVLPAFTRLLRFFPPIVIGTMIVIVGVNLVKVGAQLIIGTPGSAEYGDPRNIALGLGTIGVTVLIFWLGTGLVRRIAVMLGLLGGAVIAALSGSADFASVTDNGLVQLPTLLPFGSPQFSVAAAMPLLIYSLASMAEATGQTAINAEAVGRTDDLTRDTTRTIRGDALVTMIGGGAFGMPMFVTSGENVGIVRITGVKSRYVAVAAGFMLIGIGLFAPIASLINAVPAAVVGGTAVVVFAVIIVLGIQMLARCDLQEETTMFVVAVSLGLGLLPILLPHPYAALGDNLAILLESGVAVGALSAAVLNAAFHPDSWRRPRARTPEGPDGGIPGPRRTDAQPPDVPEPQTQTTQPHTPETHVPAKDAAS